MIKQNQSRLATACVATLLTASLWVPTAQTAPYDWNAADGVFNTAGNWTPSGGPPATGDDAYFRVAADYGVDLTGDPAIRRLYVGHGFSGPQSATFADGTLTAVNGYIGTNNGSGNHLTLDGGGVSLSHSTQYQTALMFDGTSNQLTINAGGSMSTAGGQVSLYGTDNTIEIAGGELTVAGTSRTGIGLNCSTYYRNISGSGAALTMSSGSINTTGDIAVGGGSYSQTGGAATVGNQFLAGAYGAVGTTTTVSGPTTTLTAGSRIGIGYDGDSRDNRDNTMTISNGAVATSHQVLIGSGPGSGNALIVTGSDSTLSATNGNAWQSAIQLDGTGNTLRVETGADVTTGGAAIHIYGTDNTLDIAGGTVAVTGGLGLNVNAFYGTTPVVGSGATLNMSDGWLSTTTHIRVGGGNYNQTGGTTTVSGSFHAGFGGAEGTGTLVSGTDTLLNATGHSQSNVFVGGDGDNNTLTVTDGALVNVQVGGSVGNGTGTNNKLIVTGEGATFASGRNGQYWNSWLRVSGAGNGVEVGDGGTLSTIGMVLDDGATVANTGGVYELRTGICLMEGGTISLANGTISYKDRGTDANVHSNTLPYASNPNGNRSIANIVFSGDNAFRMDNSGSYFNTDQTYTYDSVANTGDPKNYQRLVMVNGTTAIPTGVITIGSGGAMLVANTEASISQSVTNSGSFELDSDATLTVGTFSQYGGTARIDGTLVSGNSMAITGGTLGGTGSITGDVSVSESAHLSPGNSIGTLTVDGDLGLAGIFDVDVQQSGGVFENDYLVVTGELTLLDGAILNLVNLSGGPYDWTVPRVIAEYGTLAEGSMFSSFTGSPSVFRIDYEYFLRTDGQTDVFGIAIYIPEPTSLIVLALGGLALLRRRSTRDEVLR